MPRHIEATFADDYDEGKLFQELQKTDFPESLNESHCLLLAVEQNRLDRAG